MKVFVTGGTGFVGRFLVGALVDQGHQVKVLVRKKEDVALIKKMGAQPILGDLTSIRPKHGQRIDVVYHLAAIRSAWGHPWKDYYQTNVSGTVNLLEAFSKVKHFVFISSVKAAHPQTFYGKSKFQAEREALKFSKKEKLPLTIIRPAIVYGPRDDPSGMMPKLLRLIKNRRFLMVGGGENRLHLVYIDDLVQALLLVNKKRGKGRIYTIAGEKSIKLNRLVSLIAQEFKVRIIPIKIPLSLANLAGMVLEKLFQEEPIVTRNKVKTITEDIVYPITKAKKKLGYSPQVDYPEGIKKTADWYKKQWQ